MKPALGILAALTALTALAGLSGCTSDPAPDAVPEPGLTTAPPGHEELSPGWDESPDEPAPTPDDRLDDAALTALLRTRATASGADHCAAGQVTVTLEGYDQAAGHRYSRVVVRNSGDEPCVVEGVPGVGARGDWGTTFVNEVGRGSSDVPAEPVRLAPGG
ncbi:DUF4232 domain-containing protein, partial [Pimelobacter simplex]|uniref:DUF4232 domain-containing protein n=1 Tax=Nocardioides simplex TaxID=2045 RepID=UPI001EFA773B